MLKNLITNLFVTLVCTTIANAATVNDARVNMGTGNLEVDVSYGGGCAKHDFELQMNACLETFPVQCSADLLHDNNGDFCEAYLSETLEFPLNDYNLLDPYFSQGSLTIVGDGGSSATVKLPKAPIDGPCAAIYITNSSFMTEALKSKESLLLDPIEKVEVVRDGLKVDVKLTSGRKTVGGQGLGTTLKYKQSCEGTIVRR